MKLRYRSAAQSDVVRILTYLDEQSPQASQNVKERLKMAVELLLEFPYAGGATTRSGVRRLVITPYPYAIFYRVSGETLIVITFRHTARRPFPKTTD